jgi:predicted nucleotidyltransferase
LGEIAGGGTYEQLLPRTVELQVFGRTCRVVTLDALIALKRAAGRPKDLEAIAELEALRAERRGG